MESNHAQQAYEAHPAACACDMLAVRRNLRSWTRRIVAGYRPSDTQQLASREEMLGNANDDRCHGDAHSSRDWGARESGTGKSTG